MKNILAKLLPAKVDNTICGMKLTVYIFAVIAVVSTIRSLIHLLSPDGGAASIAGMNLSIAGAGGIIFAFALWGSSQLVYAIVQLLVAFRYIIEVLLRMLVGYMKPVTFAHTPPGAIGNYVVLVLAVAMLVLIFWGGKRSEVKAK
jgi:hypothetical protein